MRVFNLPDLGEGLQEATVVEWHVKPGDTLAADQTMVSVETDKAIVEVPAPFDGQIEKLFAAPGDAVRVGAPLIGFDGAQVDSGAIVGELTAIETKQEVKATPAVRSLARSLSVDLATVKGTGPGGVATSEDVKQAARGGGLRRAMAKNMATAHAAVVPVTLADDADIEHWPQGTKPLARLARAIVAACRAEPGLNAWYEDDSRKTFQEVHLGIAVDLPDGLLVPVLRNAEKSLDGLDELIRKARNRSLSPNGLRGATITLSNFGSIGARYATPLVVPPMVAIVGAGRISRQPVVTADGELAAHRVLPLSLTFDHRAATGGEATRFLNALIGDLQKGREN